MPSRKQRKRPRVSVDQTRLSARQRNAEEVGQRVADSAGPSARGTANMAGRVVAICAGAA